MTWVYVDEAVIELVNAASEAASQHFVETGRVLERLEDALEAIPIEEEA